MASAATNSRPKFQPPAKQRISKEAIHLTSFALFADYLFALTFTPLFYLASAAARSINSVPSFG
jgi:hypothetical protein